MQSKLQLNDLEQMQYFLGIEVSRQPGVISLSQKKYIMDMLDEAGLMHAKSADIPVETGLKLDPHEGEHLENPSHFRRLVGKLIYHTDWTRLVLCSKLGRPIHAKS